MKPRVCQPDVLFVLDIENPLISSLMRADRPLFRKPGPSASTLKEQMALRKWSGTSMPPEGS